MNQDGRQPFRPLDVPFNFGLPVVNEHIVSFLVNNRNSLTSAHVQASSFSNFRKRRSEDMENQDFRPRSISTDNFSMQNFFDASLLPSHSPSGSEIQNIYGTQFMGPAASWDLCAPLPAHISVNQQQRPVQPVTNYRAPEIFFDQSFWQKYYNSNQFSGGANPSAESIQYNNARPAVQTQKMLLSPLPLINWADRAELWENMLRKDVTYTRSPNCLSRHPTLQPKMRSILLSWMTEVSEVYKLHRETYYLAIDFLDRFLAATKQEVIKNNLQLVGITTLFIAAKIEEIYPPKVKEFAYVTDGACLVEEIKRMELIILSTLDWQLCPLTVVGWLSTFLQVAYLSDMSGRELGSVDMVMPKYSRDFFTSMAQILDLCILDIESLRFPYSHIAAAALFHMSNQNIVTAGSGLSIEALQPCIEWMRPYVDTLFDRGFSEQHFFEGVLTEEQHTIQSHCVNFELWERVQKKIADRRSQPQREQRELFSNLQQQNNRQWQSFAESPMRSVFQQQLPLTPLCTPPDISPPSTSSRTGNQMYLGGDEMIIDPRFNGFNYSGQ